MVKDTIINLWKLIDRPGIDNLIKFISEESDFFQAPCSTKHHLAKPGGLAEHSLNVYTLLSEKVKYFKIEVPFESVIICSLGHDLCKVNFYKEGGEPCSEAQYNYLCSLLQQKAELVMADMVLTGLVENNQFRRSIPAASATILIDWMKNRPKDPYPELPIVYSVDDKLPLGHGEKSVSILQDFIKLTDIEKLAIRWHMGSWDLSSYSGTWAFNIANGMTPLVSLLTTADFEANNILEKEESDLDANHTR